MRLAPRSTHWNIKEQITVCSTVLSFCGRKLYPLVNTLTSTWTCFVEGSQPLVVVDEKEKEEFLILEKELIDNSSDSTAGRS